MVNRNFSSISDLRDVESLNFYNELLKTMSATDAFNKILAGSRDHSRVPMQWSDSRFAGFSDAEPWIDAGSDYPVCNAAAQTEDNSSVLNYYRALIDFRRVHAALIYGDIKIVNKKKTDLFTYWRSNGKENFYIECNLSSETRKSKNRPAGAEHVLGNYPNAPSMLLRPYEAAVWRAEEKRSLK